MQLRDQQALVLQSDADSVGQEEALPDEDSTEPDAVEEEDNLDGDTPWDPEHATPWRPHRRSRRNTSQLSSLRRPSSLQPDKVHPCCLTVFSCCLAYNKLSFTALCCSQVFVNPVTDGKHATKLPVALYCAAYMPADVMMCCNIASRWQGCVTGMCTSVLCSRSM